MKEDLAAYEIDLPEGFDHKQFQWDAEHGVGSFWLCLLEDQGDFKRYTGVLYRKGKSIHDWISISLDVGPDYAYVNARENQQIPKLEIAKLTMQGLKGTKLYKDGIEIK